MRGCVSHGRGQVHMLSAARDAHGEAGTGSHARRVSSHRAYERPGETGNIFARCCLFLAAFCSGYVEQNISSLGQPVHVSARYGLGASSPPVDSVCRLHQRVALFCQHGHPSLLHVSAAPPFCNNPPQQPFVRTKPTVLLPSTLASVFCTRSVHILFSLQIVDGCIIRRWSPLREVGLYTRSARGVRDLRTGEMRASCCCT